MLSQNFFSYLIKEFALDKIYFSIYFLFYNNFYFNINYVAETIRREIRECMFLFLFAII